jgi:Short-chain dehydrogenases of various substrate specificities
MRKQKNGRILNILSINSFYSQENTTNNSLTTLAIQGMSNTLAREGSKNQIKINTLLTSPFDSYSIEKIVPVVSFLVHDSCIENGAIIEASAGFVSKLRIERGEGWFFQKITQLRT